MVDYKIRRLHGLENLKALRLAKRVFIEFDAPDYSKQGANGVLLFIRRDSKILLLNGSMIIYGAYSGAKLVGMCAMRDYSHISLLFVDKQYHRNGIAKALIKRAETEAKERNITALTVHSSLYATEIYHKMGFVDMGDKKCENDVIYTPMKKNILDRG